MDGDAWVDCSCGGRHWGTNGAAGLLLLDRIDPYDDDVNGLLCTVSTIKDSRANIELFVRRNLAAGADHMFVFLEEDSGGSYAFMLDHENVTPILTDKRYWGDARPVELLPRQMINANLINCLVSSVGSVTWLAHIDGDECLDIAKGRLLRLSAKIRCVKLAVLEAVHTERSRGGVEYFKRQLNHEELARLTELGVIEAADNRHYFFGHTNGKAVVRPGLDLYVRIHRAEMRNGYRPKHLRAPDFRVLHYDSVSTTELARKWQAHLSGGSSTFRPEREAVASAIAAVVMRDDIDEVTKRRYIGDIYQRHVEDPVDLLLELGLLVQTPKDRHSHRPAAWEPRDRQAAHDLLGRLLAVHKLRFHPDAPATAAIEVMRQVRNGLREVCDPLKHGIDEAIDRAASELQRHQRSDVHEC